MCYSITGRLWIRIKKVLSPSVCGEKLEELGGTQSVYLAVACAGSAREDGICRVK
jgi:hypothetical protein